MTFTEIVAAVCDRLNLTSSVDTARVGRLVNDRYKRVTSAIGLITSRRVQVTANTVIGEQSVTFTGCEKLINVRNDANEMLDEVTFEQLRRDGPTNDEIRRYAIERYEAQSVTILLDAIPASVRTLIADAHETAGTLSGNQAPGFSESFHDILVHGACADEHRKMEKLALAKDAEGTYEQRLGELRMWIAKSNSLLLRQGQQDATGRTTGGGASPIGTFTYTQTGLITFDRDPLAPFAVSANSAKVTNLDADLLDGQNGADYHDAAQLTGTVNALALPIANTTVNGIVSTVAQSFAGVKTFTSNTVFSANVNVSGIITGNGFGLTSVTAIDTALAFGKTEINLNVNNALTAAIAADSALLQGENSAFYRNADNINAGTLNSDRLVIANTTVKGIVSILAQSFAGIKTFTANVVIGDQISGNGSLLTSLNASELASGLVATARLATSGTANSTTFLRGDQIWATPAGGAGGGEETGVVKMFAGTMLPLDYLWCDGGDYDRTTYAALFTVIGTTFGTANSTTFKTPDMRGRTAIGVGTGTGLTARALADTVGTETHVLTTAEMPSHTHVQDAHTHVQNSHTHVQDAHTHVQNSHNHTQDAHAHLAVGTNTGATAQPATFAPSDRGSSTFGNPSVNSTTATNQAATATNQNTTAVNQSTTAVNQNATATNQNTGGGGAHQNMQPSLALNFIIRT
jgi:microcystin-dependent protein